MSVNIRSCARAFALATLLVVAATNARFARAETNLDCNDRKGGKWMFGVAPDGCRIPDEASEKSFAVEFAPLIFDETNPEKQERVAYMNQMYAFLRSVTSYYIHRRNPNVSTGEANGFTEGVLALAHQESFWTHFRHNPDGNMRYMRGDSDHGHGLMEVDDRWHIDALKEGRGLDLMYNILYGLDYYYTQWQRSAKADCVDSPTSYVQRAKSAWSAYNGGPGSICRWTDDEDPDTDYDDKITGKLWLKYVNKPALVTSLDVVCLSVGQRPCAKGAPAPATTPAPSATPVPGASPSPTASATPAPTPTPSPTPKPTPLPKPTPVPKPKKPAPVHWRIVTTSLDLPYVPLLAAPDVTAQKSGAYLRGAALDGNTPGESATVVQEQGDWLLVQKSDNSQGWMPKSSAEETSP